MSEVDSRKSVYLTRQVAALLVRDAARESSRPALQHIFFEDGFAYYTNRFLIVRWDLRGLKIANGSWIDLVPPDTDSQPDVKFDISGNLAAWAKIATRRSSWNLMNQDHWKSPDSFDGTHPAVAKIMTLPEGDIESISAVAFDYRFLQMLALIVSGSFSNFIRLMPSSAKNARTKGWWITGADDNVQAMLVPMRFSNDDLPYVPNSPEAEKDQEATK
jgi:hypothetical protein